MKTPEKIKKGLKCYRGKHPFAIGNCPSGCPYEKYGTSCRDMMNTDALAYIQQLETELDDEKNKNEILISDNDKLMEEIAQVERERDAAVSDIHTVLHNRGIDADCLMCNMKKPECKWECENAQWRGPCPENTKEEK